jgi:hypothetical protein
METLVLRSLYLENLDPPVYVVIPRWMFNRLTRHVLRLFGLRFELSGGRQVAIRRLEGFPMAPWRPAGNVTFLAPQSVTYRQ